MTARSAADPLTRRDAMYLFYNLLSAATPEGAPYIESLGHSLDASGRVDLLELVNGEMEGPAVAQGDWQSALPFDPALGTVYRDGSRVSPAAVQDYDVLYWNASVSTVWAYSRKASGAIQALEPDQSAPTSVTVAGRAYSIETSQAAYALSDLGDYGLGDTVTLLLGRSGGVAAVADVSAAGAGERVGMVIQVSEQQYPDGAGGSYTAQTVTLLATDGQTYQYQTRGGYRVGSVVRAGSFGQDGQITLRGLSSSSLTGRVSDNGEKLGDYRFAPGATILDVADGQGAVYFPERLAGVSLSSGDVRYYSLNSQGEIDQMILEEVTGDMYQYGILTRREEMGEGLDRIYSYEYDVAGRTTPCPPPPPASGPTSAPSSSPATPPTRSGYTPSPPPDRGPSPAGSSSPTSAGTLCPTRCWCTSAIRISIVLPVHPGPGPGGDFTLTAGTTSPRPRGAASGSSWPGRTESRVSQPARLRRGGPFLRPVEKNDTMGAIKGPGQVCIG